MGAADGSLRIFVGCCGWFPAIELQDTFYQPPPVELARRWRSEAPAQFKFSLKAWQSITHPASSPTYRRLKDAIHRDRLPAYGFFRPTEDVAAAWRRTLSVARALEAETVVFQCPASFKENDENLANLEAFFRTAERDGRIFAWEPRGPWHAAVVRALCEKLGLVHCVDPFQAEPVAGHAVYLRLHGRGAYRYQYTDGDLIERGRRAVPAARVTRGAGVSHQSHVSAA